MQYFYQLSKKSVHLCHLKCAGANIHQRSIKMYVGESLDATKSCNLIMFEL